MLKFKSINDIKNQVRHNIHYFNKYDIVVGIPRSGMLIALMIGLELNKLTIQFSDLLDKNFKNNYSSRMNAIKQNNDRKLKIIICDDSINTSETIKKIKNQIEVTGLNNLYEIHYFAAYATKKSKDNIDLYFELIEQPRIFEWNLFHHEYGKNFLWDFDGVFCNDPSDLENDDGEKYLNFLKYAEPKIIPSKPIGMIVSARLEKYREQSIDWLKKNSINYSTLFLLNSTAELRKKNSLHKIFKAEVYSRTNSLLFIESDIQQASWIYEKTQKPVYCIETSQFLN
jgi:uncharacterized HAD superfamily protein/hypoxanthine phosphoribosyltransferase